ncbi:winged helix-turn-helix domain-containing protein [Pedobacter cryophilus]|uniref:Winged helix-turn-helix transcriptional regulator n=1 Tax=Pedobacter cryophilus TaxID=2571271 RepID=A0A4U1BWQ0_9SPHI|nr:winged helix-turn-helix domain-containing protein [Pedobacter cryophilus]TKB96932.1 winged helix-turn-helix transcriptional regulator [Pedobacter cryophilus]
MDVSLNLLSGKRKYLLGFIMLLSLAVMCTAFSMIGSDDFDIAKREILLRRIGHELLLQSGDSTSRVLPIKKISENEYQISFENELTFEPSYLVDITNRLLAKDPLANDYVVNVINCSNSSIVYGYAISKNKKDDIVSCIGRKQASACYKVNIKFKQTGLSIVKSGYLLGSLSLLAFFGFIFFRVAKPPKALLQSQDTDLFTLGSVCFDPKNRKLNINGKTIELTGTESRLLLIFAQSPNETIERSRLQKEIWEDDGVIVGRSLDMFISKLRKKLELDPNINIVVTRGKGYKLDLGNPSFS